MRKQRILSLINIKQAATSQSISFILKVISSLLLLLFNILLLTACKLFTINYFCNSYNTDEMCV